MIYIVFLEAVPRNKSIRISVAIKSLEEELSISARVENDAQSSTSLSAVEITISSHRRASHLLQ